MIDIIMRKADVPNYKKVYLALDQIYMYQQHIEASS